MLPQLALNITLTEIFFQNFLKFCQRCLINFWAFVPQMQKKPRKTLSDDQSQK